MRYLRDVEIDFDEAVTNVAAAALLINGSPATNLTAFTASQYIFEFPQPPTGTVQLAWAAGQGIQDLAGNSFAGGGWTYRLDPNAPVPDIQISEFMAENVNSIRDEDGDYSDWIELLNPTDDDLNLSGWALTDDALDLQKWRLPNVTLSAHSYLLVFASGKDRTNATGQLHANSHFERGRRVSRIGGYRAEYHLRLFTGLSAATSRLLLWARSGFTESDGLF